MDNVGYTVHPERTIRIRSLLYKRAEGDLNLAAYLGMLVLADGRVHVDAVAIEPPHAQALLVHLDEVRQILLDFIHEHQPHEQASKVVALPPARKPGR